MTQPTVEEKTKPNIEDELTPEEEVALPDELIYAVEEALEEGEKERFLGIIESLHAADLADYLDDKGMDLSDVSTHRTDLGV